MKQEFDVIIVGGGMAGASLALLLKEQIEQGLKVALVDAHSADLENLQQPSFDARTTALSLGTKRILDKLDIWSGLSHQACPIEHIQVSQQSQFGRIRLHAQDSQVEAMGYVLENRVLGQHLWQALLELESLTLFAPAQVKRYQVNEQGAQLQISQDNHDTNLQAQLVVLADGANSEGCRQLGITQSRHDYHQTAVVCNVSFDQVHEHWAYERFTSQGPMALLPMTNNRFALVWCMSKSQAHEYCQLDDEAFKQTLQKAVGYKVGRLNRVGERISYPLSLVMAKEQVRSNVVVMGNAAHAMHPVAGQGFNLALRDAHALARQITSSWPQKGLGSIELLNEYLSAQIQDQQTTVALSHGLPKGFTQPGAAWSILRAFNMSLMDVSPVTKKLFTKQAMGLVGKTNPWQP